MEQTRQNPFNRIRIWLHIKIPNYIFPNFIISKLANLLDFLLSKLLLFLPIFS